MFVTVRMERNLYVQPNELGAGLRDRYDFFEATLYRLTSFQEDV